MRLISKHSDYYDSASQFGIDTTQVLVRENKTDQSTLVEDKIKKYLDILPNTGYRSHLPFSVESFLVGFCGKLIPVYEVSYTDPETKKTNWPQKISKFCFNIKQVEDAIQFIAPSFLQKKWLEKSNVDIFGYHRNPFTKSYLELVEKELANASNVVTDLSHEYKCAYFKFKDKSIYGEQHVGYPVEFYPVLKDMDFARYLDPFSAHQEISQFYFGVIGSAENNIINISDKDKVIGKGFDKDYGFRTRPKS